MTCSPALALVCAIVVATATPALSDCLNADREAIVQGQLDSGTFTDANERPENAYILKLAAPACLEGHDKFDKVKGASTIQIYSGNDEIRKRIESFLGWAVRVRGTPFGAHTAHHHAPIVMNVVDIQPR